jgi:hypothetical protein
MASLKHIPVSEPTWKVLAKMKQAGETYDLLLQKLVQQLNRFELSEKFSKAEMGEGEWIKLKDIK